MLCLALAGALAFNVWNGIRTLNTARSDHTEWVYSQLEIEYLKLDRALAQARSSTPEGLRNLRKRFDIFYSRVDIAEKMQHDAAIVPDIARLRRMLDGQIPLIDAGDTALRAGLDDLQSALHEVENVPREIALASVALSASAEETERQRIIRLIEVLFVVAIAVALALLGAILRLSGQARSLDQASHQAREHQTRLETTLRASLDAVVVTDDRGVIRDFNGSAEAVFGLSRQDAVGRDFIDLIVPPHLRQAQRDNLDRFRRTGVPLLADQGRFEYELMDRDSRCFPADLSISLANSDTGPIFVSYIRDITDKKHKEAEITRARDEALEAYREKSRFFAMMSHEMRTPLNGVLSALQLLRDSALDGEQREFLYAAMTSGDILLGHIDDVLAIERSETETGDETLHPCDATALTSGLVGMMTPLAQTSATRLHLNQSGLDDRQILTDPRALQQILVNLLSNAIKFSPNGDVTLAATYRPGTGADQQVLHLRVEDTGPGIAAADLDRIFEDFVSLDSRYERRTGGTGLGLGIARRLVRRLGGTIHCLSTPGEGAQFIVDLPVRRAPVSVPRPRRDPMETPVCHPALSLLVADDNQINRDLLKAMLERMGHDVALAPGGQEAIDVAGKRRFDAILMDISMPGVNGIQATRAILSAPGPNCQTPILAVTAHALPEERAEFTAAGMIGCVQKPVDMSMLKSALTQSVTSGGAAVDASPASAAADRTPDVPGSAVSTQQSRTSLTGPGGEGLTAAAAPPSESKKKPTAPLLEQADEDETPLLDEAQLLQLLDLLGRDKLSERISALVQRMQDELPGLIRAQELAELQSRAHAMAGMCGMFGAKRLHQNLEQIEAACKSGALDRAMGLTSLLPQLWERTQHAWRQRILQ